MSTVGALNNATVVSTFTGGGNKYWYNGANVATGGTATDLQFYARNRNAPGTFNTFDWAIYAGGDASGPNGATLIWQSAYVNGTSFAVSDQWNSAFGLGAGTGSGVFSTGYLWTVLRSGDGIFQSQVDGSDVGDWQSVMWALADAGGNAGSSWPSTFPGNGSAQVTSPLKSYITYTATGGSTFPPLPDKRPTGMPPPAILGMRARRRPALRCSREFATEGRLLVPQRKIFLPPHIRT